MGAQWNGVKATWAQGEAQFGINTKPRPPPLSRPSNSPTSTPPSRPSRTSTDKPLRPKSTGSRPPSRLTPKSLIFLNTEPECQQIFVETIKSITNCLHETNSSFK